MKRISMTQRNVAATPVHTKMITSTFGLPSSPGKRRTVVNYQTSLAKKSLCTFHDPISCHIILTDICEELWSKEDSLLKICTPAFWLEMLRLLFHVILLFIYFFLNFLWEIVYKKEVETHFGVYFWIVWDMHTALFPIVFSSKHCFSIHPCRHS